MISQIIHVPKDVVLILMFEVFMRKGLQTNIDDWNNNKIYTHHSFFFFFFCTSKLHNDPAFYSEVSVRD